MLRLGRTHLKRSIPLYLSSPETGPNFDSFDGVSPTLRPISACARKAFGWISASSSIVTAIRPKGKKVFLFIVSILAQTIHPPVHRRGSRLGRVQRKCRNLLLSTFYVAG